MRIAHVSDGYLPRPGGIEHHVHDLATRQAQLGHDVVVVTTVPGRSPDGAVRVVRPAPGAAAATGMRHTWALKAAQLEELHRADVVHVHTSNVSPLAFLVLAARARSGAPTLATMHSMLHHSSPLFRANATVLRWNRPNIAWTAVSSAAARRLQAAFGGDRAVSVLPNAVEPEEWITNRPARLPDRLVVASAGRLVTRKRPLAALAMLQAAREQLSPRIRLEAVLFGEGPQRGRLERFVRRHEMADWVSLPGATSRAELARRYADTDVFLSPARLESFGIATLEARYAGLTVLANAGSGAADFVRHAVDGVLADDDAGMVRALITIATQSRVRQSLAANAAGNPPELSWDHVLPRTFECYERVMGRPALAHALP